MSLTLSEVFRQKKNNTIYEPIEINVNIKYILVKNDEFIIEPKSRRLPLAIDSEALFREVIVDD